MKIEKECHITALVMVKNESLTIERTLDSLFNDDATCKVDRIAIFDTGSTDDTLEKCKTYANKTDLVTKEDEFVDFSVSRNKSRDWVESLGTDWILFLDSNDELRNADGMRKFLDEAPAEIDGYYTLRHLKMPDDTIKFKTVNLQRAGRGWTYYGPVHEYPDIRDDEGKSTAKSPLSSIILYQQHREKDLEKTKKRHAWDKQVLIKALEEDPDNARNQFYLGQTLNDLNEKEEALEAFSKRAGMTGFAPDGFSARLHCGDICLELSRIEEAIVWYLRATTYSEQYLGLLRAEGLYAIGIIYRMMKLYKLAFTFLNNACNVPPLPEDIDGSFNNLAYTYLRYKRLAEVTIELDDMLILRRGIQVCTAALNTGINVKDDEELLDALVDKFKKLYPDRIQVNSPDETEETKDGAEDGAEETKDGAEDGAEETKDGAEDEAEDTMTPEEKQAEEHLKDLEDEENAMIERAEEEANNPF